MFRIPSEAVLRDAFRPRDQASLVLADGTTFPLFVRHYLAWSEPSGAWCFLIFKVRGGVPTGIAFRRGSALRGLMCEWCHAFDPSAGVSLLTADRNSRKRVGLYVCTDLGCQTRIEDAALRAGKSPLVETEQLLVRIGRFAEQALGIDPTGAGRNAPSP